MVNCREKVKRNCEDDKLPSYDKFSIKLQQITLNLRQIAMQSYDKLPRKATTNNRKSDDKLPYIDATNCYIKGRHMNV